MKLSFLRQSLAALVAAAATICGNSQVSAAISTFDSLTPGTNAAVRATWLTAMGITAPDHLVNFESGFTDGQNISGVSGLFPDGLVIIDAGLPGPPAATIESGSISGSNPVGIFALEHDDDLYLELDFSAQPVDYIGFLGIDHGPMIGIVTFVGGATATFTLDTTMAQNDSAEFYGIFRNDMPLITLVQLGTSGDGWGIDSIEYGNLQQSTAVPEPATLTMFATVMLGLIGARSRRQRARAFLC